MPKFKCIYLFVAKIYKWNNFFNKILIYHKGSLSICCSACGQKVLSRLKGSVSLVQVMNGISAMLRTWTISIHIPIDSAMPPLRIHT